MVFIESPCGVGFSYSDTPSVDYIASDASTAVTNYHLIQGFFRRFPEYSTNDLYLTSESYGGHCKILLYSPSLISPPYPSPLSLL
jgi:serine carboxypeptidase-like clade II